MTACITDRKTMYREGIELEFLVKGTTRIFAGSMVAVDNTGYAVPAANTAGIKFIGIAMEQADNRYGNNGAIFIRVRTAGVFKFNAVAIHQSDVGREMYIVDDQTFIPFDPLYIVSCGTLVKYISETEGWIRI